MNLGKKVDRKINKISNKKILLATIIVIVISTYFIGTDAGLFAVITTAPFIIQPSGDIQIEVQARGGGAIEAGITEFEVQGYVLNWSNSVQNLPTLEVRINNVVVQSLQIKGLTSTGEHTVFLTDPIILTSDATVWIECCQERGSATALQNYINDNGHSPVIDQSDSQFVDIVSIAQTKTCSDGSVIPINNSCPVVVTDSDGDGIPNTTDQCDNDPETFNGYQDTDGCPDTNPSTDSDGDGIPDITDQCPLDDENFNQYQDTDGCPDVKPSVDSDNDGITDEFDVCPTQGGVVQQNGCPFPQEEAPQFQTCPDGSLIPLTSTCSNPPPPEVIDIDGDGVTDDVDQCPFIGGAIDPSNGCPFPDETTGGDITDPTNPDVNQSGVSDCDFLCQLFSQDSDGDGIIDIDDLCPQTVGIITEGGCPTGTFNTGSGNTGSNTGSTTGTSTGSNTNTDTRTINDPNTTPRPSNFSPEDFPLLVVSILVIGIAIFAVILRTQPAVRNYFNLGGK